MDFIHLAEAKIARDIVKNFKILKKFLNAICK